MQTFDASSIIYAWDNYPPEQFPPLWRWIAERIEAGEFSIPEPALEEVERRLPECAAWLQDKHIERVTVTNEILQEALRIKDLLGIEEDRYHAKGVGENDLLIIATARIQGFELVSNEGRQHQFPTVAAKAKIPAVCDMEDVDVLCVDFITLIKRSGEVFGGHGP